MNIYGKQMEIERELENNYSHFFGACVGAPSNQKLSGPQKDLLLWHWKLGVSMYRIQDLMRPRKFEEQNSNINILTMIINTKFPAARNCVVPSSESCMLERLKKCWTNTKKVNHLEEKEEYLSRDKIEVGDFFQLIHSFVGILVVYLLVMGGSNVIVIFKEVLFILILILF